MTDREAVIAIAKRKAAARVEAMRRICAEEGHDWKTPPDWQSGYCRRCGISSTQR